MGHVCLQDTYVCIRAHTVLHLVSTNTCCISAEGFMHSDKLQLQAIEVQHTCQYAGAHEHFVRSSIVLHCWYYTVVTVYTEAVKQTIAVHTVSYCV
jgi:hypothetical protein